jgi:orotidine-5'-phosphate decarboxylase
MINSVSDYSPWLNWLKNPICIALDLDRREDTVKLAQKLSHAGGFKLGPRLIHRYGPEIVKEISQLGPVFVDCKFFDIPSTTVAAVQACFDSGATLVTVHAMVGTETLNQLKKLEDKLAQIRPFKILFVTILTSWSQENLPSSIKNQSIAELVKNLSNEILQSGLTGLVCSGHELDFLDTKKLWCLVPGVRREQDVVGDQKRTLTPNLALSKGASALVVGRPIIESRHPEQELEKFLQSL